MSKGTVLLMINQYTFSKGGALAFGGSRWCCSCVKSRNCKAYVHLKRNNDILRADLDHDHAPVKYMPLADGSYIKI